MDEAPKPLSERIAEIQNAVDRLLTDPKASSALKTSAQLFINRAVRLRAQLIVAEADAKANK